MENNQIPTTAIVLVIFAIVGLLMFLAMLFFFGLLIRIAMRRRQYNQKRGAEMAAVAREIGFNFKPQTELTDVPVLANFDMFEGNVIKIENLMTGKINGKNVSLFDCVYMNVASPGSGGVTNRETNTRELSALTETCRTFGPTETEPVCAPDAGFIRSN